MAKGIRKKYKNKKIIKDIKPIKMELEDIPQIIEIYKSFWGSIDLYKNSQFKKIIKQNLSYLYKIKNEVIAYCLVEFKNNKNTAEIDLLCVKKEFQRYHLGETLLSFCLTNCVNLNIKTFYLHVSTNNTPALKLYQKKGFTTKNFIKKYYNDKNPEDNDAFLMILNVQ